MRYLIVGHHWEQRRRAALLRIAPLAEGVKEFSYYLFSIVVCYAILYLVMYMAEEFESRCGGGH